MAISITVHPTLHISAELINYFENNQNNIARICDLHYQCQNITDAEA